MFVGFGIAGVKVVMECLLKFIEILFIFLVFLKVLVGIEWVGIEWERDDALGCQAMLQDGSGIRNW